MRDFLQDKVEFEWPSSLGEISGSHCNLRPDSPGIPLKFIKKVSDKKASIDEYEGLPSFKFKKHFVVKTIREWDSQKNQRMTAKEVDNMKGLRHPHIAALLGTFTYQARVSILIFPAARCDLQYFMNSISEDPSDLTTTDTSQQLHSLDATPEISSTYKGGHRSSWPVTLSVERGSEILRGYFVCLSQALCYLHEQDVRHKDIKPANILIDQSYSVILTDFGISRRFPKNSSHVTDDEARCTWKYASPEMTEDRRMGRDDASDVFSLGCVFLEMATLLLKGTLKSLSDHCSTTVNESAKDEAYHRNLQKVYLWIRNLRILRESPSNLEHRASKNSLENQKFPPSSDNHLIEALAVIQSMLDEIPQNRPASKELLHPFQDISLKPCRDCDPRSDEMWKPSVRQKLGEEKDLSKRQSLKRQSLHTHVENRERDPFRKNDSATLSAPNVPCHPSPVIRDFQSAVVEDRNKAGSSQRSELSPKAIPRDIEESASTFSTASMLDTVQQPPPGDTSTKKPTPFDQARTQHTAANTTPWSRNSRPRGPQRGGINQITLANCEILVRVPQDDMPPFKTPIIAYVRSKNLVFQTHGGWLECVPRGINDTSLL